MLRNPQKTVRGAAKVGVAAGLVVGLFGAIVAFYPSIDRGEISVVRESSADIFALSFGPRSNTEKFGTALERLGHEPPRVYRTNENAVFFSTALVRNRTPNEVLRDYQEEFVRQGLNKQVYRTPVSLLARQGDHGKIREIQEAGMNGEVVPYQLDPTFMSMGGAVMDLADEPAESPDFGQTVASLEAKLSRFQRAYEACGGSEELLSNEAGALPGISDRISKAATSSDCITRDGKCDDVRERYTIASSGIASLKGAIDKQPNLQTCPMLKNASLASVEASMDKFTSKVKAFRSIEAMYDAKSNATHVSATWSDENFDATKFRGKTELNETKVGQSLPLCDGCRRTWDFGGKGSESPYSTTQINSPNSVSLVSDYYVRKLEQEGWKITDSQKASEELMRLSNKEPGSRWLRVARGNEAMTIRVSNDPRGGSRIVATTAN